MLSALGIGTNRFETGTPEDMERSTEIVREAIDSGLNYIDVAYSYSNWKAEEIVRDAIKRTDNEVHITVKSSFCYGDKTKEQTINRVKKTLESLELKKASFFVAWTIFSYDEFLESIKPGGSYNGAVALKQEGLVDHICASFHAPPNDIIKIMEHGLFEGITISYSAINQTSMQPVLDKAGELGIGIVTMNSLGGGIIPSNPDFFSFIKKDQDKDVTSAALRFSYAHPQITTMLSSMPNEKELFENIATVSTEENQESKICRINAVNEEFSELKGFCTGCRYCADCPTEIDIPVFMQAYNTMFFTSDQPMYRRTNKRLLENIGICKLLKNDYQFIPPDVKNPCLKCGKCENVCTQSIPIMNRIDELYLRFDEGGFSKAQFGSRLEGILKVSYKKIAFYPAGGYTSVVLGYIKEYALAPDSEIFLFDGNPKSWGNFNAGIEILDPATILEICPDIVVVSNYVYLDEIYEQIRYIEDSGISVIKLHEPNDVPWLY
jgi:predicted aldo/keto reductase-like oxidoreductase